VRFQGRISNWNDEKGYGFVSPNGGGDRAFVHIKAFAGRRRRPVDGDVITYAVAKDERNRLRAEDVRYPHRPIPVTNRISPRYTALLIVAFAAVVAALSLLGKTAFFVPFMYLAASAVTFLVYGFDKSAAMNNRWRTPESTLHILGLIGGWPGALMAQQIFRHKSKKAEFRVIFWLTVVVNCAALAWSATPSGAAVIEATFGIR
jgi:uncharacterized membrane protein YsdA (DUF1294 family)/cold shock CspA family protein